jgi:uncharacterized protein (TIGR01777 family)
MNVLVTGSHGLIGSALVRRLCADGHKVAALVRGRATSPHEIGWDPAGAGVDSDALEGFDAVVHLAGESIAAGRWTEKQKQKIRDSRVQGTRILCQALADLERPPQSLVVASAIGYYGDRDDEVLDESSSPGTGFLSDVCQQWEAACESARRQGIRTVNTRFGVVLSGDGGALKKMLLPFKLGVGGRIGAGRQWMSWVDLDDVVGAIEHCLNNAAINGAVNVVSPNAVTNAEFTKSLGRVLHRPTIFPLPAPVARLVLGEMADGLLLSSAHVEPIQLKNSGYQFRYPELELSLRHALDM